MNTAIKKNANALNQELKWFSEVIDTRLQLFLGNPCRYADIFEIDPPDLSEDDSFYAEVVKRDIMNFSERIVLLLALTPHIKPELLDRFLLPNVALDRPFTEFGGMAVPGFSGFCPTGETAAFLLSNNDLERRFDLFNLFCDDHYFHRRNILHMEKFDSSDPYLSGLLKISLEYLSYLTIGVSKFTSQGS